MSKKSVLLISILVVFVLSLSACSFLGGGEATVPVLSRPSGFSYDAISSLLSWTAVNNATGYELSITDGSGKQSQATASSNDFLFTTQYGTITVKVKAVGNGTDYLSSEFSSEYTFVRTRTYANLTIHSRVDSDSKMHVTFTAVENAGGYNFKIESIGFYISFTPAQVVTEGSFSVDLSGKDYGDYFLNYQIKGDGVYYPDGEWKTHTLTYAAPEKATMSATTVTFDKISLLSLSVSVIFNDSVAVKLLSTQLSTLADSHYNVDYYNNVIVFTSEAILSYAPGSYAVTIQTSLGNLNFTLEIKDSRAPYSTISKITMFSSSLYTAVIPLQMYGATVTGVSIASYSLNATQYSLEKDGDLTNLTISYGAFNAFPKESKGEEEGDTNYNIDITTSAPSTINITLEFKAGAGEGMLISAAEYTYDLALGGDLAVRTEGYIAGKMYNRSNVLSDTNDLLLANVDYVQTTDEEDDSVYFFTLLNSYLRRLTVGRHYVSFNSHIFDCFISINVINSQATPYDVRLDVDSAGTSQLLWDFDGTASGYSVEITDGEDKTVVSSAKNSTSLADFAGADSVIVRVASDSNKLYSAPVTVKLPIIPSTYFGTYTYLGVSHNYVISSLAEFQNVIEYAYYNQLESVPFFYTAPQSYASLESRAGSLARINMNFARNGLQHNVSQNKEECVISVSQRSNYNIVKEPTLKSGQTDEVENSIFQSYCFYPNTRSQSYVFELDKVTASQPATTSNQLVYLAEMGVKPICAVGSDAERMYKAARTVLLDICDDSMTDFQKVHSIFDWLILNTTYDQLLLKKTQDNTISSADCLKYNAFYLEGVFDDGIAVCDGYSKAIVLLCALEGIPAYRVTGSAGSVAHAWNKVYIDGKWYVCDATWANRSVVDGADRTEYLFHSYLLCSDAYNAGRHDEYDSIETVLRNSGVFSESVSYNAKNEYAVGNYDVYAASATDHLYKVDSYLDMVAIINEELSTKRVLEFKLGLDVSSSSVENYLDNGTYITVSRDDYIFLFNSLTAEANDTVLVIYTYFEDISFTSAVGSYDVKAPQDIVFNYQLNDSTLKAITFNGLPLSNIAYTLTADAITVHTVWLSTLAEGNHSITVETNFGTHVLTVGINDTRAASFDKSAIYLNVLSGEDVNIAVEQYSDSITSISLYNSAISTEHYRIEDGVLIIDNAAFTAYAYGSYNLVIITQNFAVGNTIRVTLSDVDSGAPYVSSGRSLSVDLKTPVSRSFTVDNVVGSFIEGAAPLIMNKGVVLGNDDYSYNASGGNVTFTLKQAFLAGLDCGAYQLSVNTNVVPLIVNLSVTNSAEAPTNVRMDYYGNQETLVWDFQQGGSFDVTIGSVTKTVNTTSCSLAQFETGNSFSVSVKSAITQGTATKAITKPTSDVTAYKETISFMGDNFNTYITSVEDLALVLRYALFYQLSEIDVLYAINEVTGANIDAAKNEALDIVGQSYASAYSMGGSYYDSGSQKGQWTITFTNYTPQSTLNNSSLTTAVQSNDIAPCYTSLNTRAANFIFAIDGCPSVNNVATSEQLVFVVENGYRPVCVPSSRAEQVYNAARAVLREILDNSMNDYTKVHYIYDWLISNVTYDYVMLSKYKQVGASSAELKKYNSFYLEGVFNDGLAVCEGISKAFMLLCRIEGIEAIRAEGTSEGVGHAWNKVLINEKWYGIDATWGNSKKTAGTSPNQYYCEYLSHAYLLIPDCTMNCDHTESNVQVISTGSYIATVYDENDEDSFFFVTGREELKTAVNFGTTLDVIEILIGYEYTSISAELTAIQSMNGYVLSSGYTYIANEETDTVLIFIG